MSLICSPGTMRNLLETRMPPVFSSYGDRLGESGRTSGGSSAFDASLVEARNSGVGSAVVGLANLMTHAIAHDVFVPHNETNINNLMFRDARPEFLTNPNVQFLPAQAVVLQKRFNTKEEQEVWERQQSQGGSQR